MSKKTIIYLQITIEDSFQDFDPIQLRDEVESLTMADMPHYFNGLGCFSDLEVVKICKVEETDTRTL